ncbi:hypothetical protein ACYSNO_11850 [Enterococcus sp. LJL98]
MEIIGNLEQILEAKKIGEISFIRSSFYDHRFAGEEKEASITAMIQMVLSLKKEKPTNFTILKNETSLLVTFDFNHECLVNLAFATWEEVTTPVLKIEVVGKNGMIQFDTQADNAYAGTYYHSSLSLKTPEISPELATYTREFVEKIKEANEMEVVIG